MGWEKTQGGQLLRYSRKGQDKTTIMRIRAEWCRVQDQTSSGGNGREEETKSPNHNTRGRAVDIVSKAVALVRKRTRLGSEGSARAEVKF